MPSLKLSNPFRRNAARPSLKERAAALRATAAKVMKREPAQRSAADRVREMMQYHEGFAPYPTEAPMSLLAIDSYIPLEAKRLLDLACREYERLHPYQSAGKDAAGRQAVADRLRREYRIAELEAVIAPRAVADSEGLDPVFAAIAASRKAEAAVQAFSVRVAGTKLTEADFAEEAKLVAAQSDAFDASLAIVPTTLAGARALVDHLEWRLGLHGIQDWKHPADDAWFFGPMLKALATTIMTLPTTSAQPDRDLSTCTLPQLARLHETIENVWRHISAETQSPCFWDDCRENFNAAGSLLNEESDRLCGILDVIDREAQRRASDGGRDRDERLSVLLRQELLRNGKIADRALLSEAVAAWGA